MQQNQPFQAIATPLNARVKPAPKKRIYIAGKVTGLPYNDVVGKFHTAHLVLQAQGWEVVNPVKFTDKDCEWKEAMKGCIIQLVTCHAIYLLPDYFESKGALLEHMIAEQLELEVIHA